MIKQVERAQGETTGENHAQGPPTNLFSLCRWSATGSPGRFGERSTDIKSKQGLCTRHQGLSYSWPSLKWNPKMQVKKCPINYIDFMRTRVVSEITCEICKAAYIESTVRALHERAKEHLASAKKKTKTSAMGVHYKTCHKKSKPKMSFRIVCTTERDELRLRIEEAQVIHTMKPAINRRGEETAIDFLAWTLPPKDQQVMLFCTAKQLETKQPALTLNNQWP